MSHSFSVDLGGLIDLLSEHLYSGPEVYVRELMQNGVDAIRARQQQYGEEFSPALSFDLEGDTLTFADNGVGLTPDDIHTFLATIGRSSKRGNIELIGQFGIGLLACFLVSEDIELVSRSASGTPPLRWLGRADGSYTLEDGPLDTPIGTRVTLKAREGRAEYLLPERVSAWAGDFGGLLPFPITANGVAVNENGVPWLDVSAGEEARRAAVMAYGTQLLGQPPLDFVDINTAAGGVRGVAFILPWTPTLERRGQHRVYVRHMLLSDKEEELTPRWAFFIRAVLDTQALRPNAARDALREDGNLRAAREEIAGQLRAYLVNLAERDPAALRRLIELHYLSIKALAAEDDTFLDLFMPWLPFETSAGSLALPDYLALGSQEHPEIRFSSDLNLYRQAAQLALPGQTPIIRAIYTYDSTLLARYAALHGGVRLTQLTHDDLVQEFSALTPQELARTATLREVARDTLLPLEAEARVSRFAPAELPALAFARSHRDLTRTREKLGGAGGGLWADLLGDLGTHTSEAAAEVHFNMAHPLIQQAAQLPDGLLLRRVLGMLYVQALLLGQHPLTTRELALLNTGLSDLIVDALAGAGTAEQSSLSQMN
ncbi:HSP90 family protein [Deinococcus arenicola]|uniref:HSP90 family protein n=1 Tax=Deinococcus arenicola TaxID=2994950 RepID=A0ABU4DSS8_9DEIO|nr:HSP90 family protein [Deinococcus sp. ZS9-10]MDV6375022.1 HSP90 family protein [Deinococcus sp. ZS9-10]